MRKRYNEMKKLVAVVLALTLVMGMGTTAFARKSGDDVSETLKETHGFTASVDPVDESEPEVKTLADTIVEPTTKTFESTDYNGVKFNIDITNYIGDLEDSVGVAVVAPATLTFDFSQYGIEAQVYGTYETLFWSGDGSKNGFTESAITYGDKISLGETQEMLAGYTLELATPGTYRVTTNSMNATGETPIVILVEEAKEIDIVKEEVKEPIEPIEPKVVLPMKATANPTKSPVEVNGEKVEFDAYNINGNNFFKLRDVAKIVNGSAKQFGVTWDSEKSVIDLKSSTPYVSVGGEMTLGDGNVKEGLLNESPIYKDGVMVDLAAYNINGNNYFKLRDLADAFDIGVYWDGERGTVVIDTTIGYDPNM